MTNVMEWKWPEENVITFPRDHTYLDQGLVSKHLIQEGAVIGGGVETEHGFYKSDHNMGAIEVNFSQIVGKIQKINNTAYTRRRTLRYGQKNSGQLRRAVGGNSRRTNSTETKKRKANTRRTNKKNT